jgi:hypothetical protein
MSRKLLIATATIVAACVTGIAASGGFAGSGAASGSEPGAVRSPGQAPGAGLPSFTTCMQLLRYAKGHALKMVGPYGLEGIGFPYALPAAGEAAPPAADTSAPTRDDFSGTNVQEEGVDEPDIVKTNGDVVFAVAQGRLNAVDVSGPLPSLLGSLELESSFGQQLLLYGDRLLVIGTEPIFILEPLGAQADILPPRGVPSTTLTEIDVSNPVAMQVVRTMTLDASYVSARLVGSTARLVVTSAPSGFPFVYPETGEPADLAAAKKRNRAIVKGSKISNWLPGYTLTDRLTGKTTRKALLTCRQVRHPSEFAGLGTISVLTLDLAQGIEPIDTDAVMSAGDTVYASTQSLYVATQQWLGPNVFAEPDVTPPSVTTAIHKFDISSPVATEYRGSGEVEGYLLNQWSLSEKDGFLRVVSTDAPLWWGGEEAESESAVSVLAEAGGRLETVGRLGGLGRGERVYAVRFIGDLGYVVTFRQVDPLHVVDVSDPTNPVLRGELHIPGYSAYLHPIGEGLLLGIGQEATPDGRVLGTQVSVFDVTSPDNPVRVQQLLLGQGWTEIEFDHHAFLYWPATSLAVVPLETWSFDEATGVSDYSAGAVALHVGPGGIVELGRISHEALPSPDPSIPAYPTPIRRTLVVGDGLYTVSDAGLKASDLATLADRAWVPFPVPVPDTSGAGAGTGVVAPPPAS